MEFLPYSSGLCLLEKVKPLQFLYPIFSLDLPLENSWQQTYNCQVLQEGAHDRVSTEKEKLCSDWSSICTVCNVWIWRGEEDPVRRKDVKADPFSSGTRKGGSWRLVTGGHRKQSWGLGLLTSGTLVPLGEFISDLCLVFNPSAKFACSSSRTADTSPGSCATHVALLLVNTYVKLSKG